MILHPNDYNGISNKNKKGMNDYDYLEIGTDYSALNNKSSLFVDFLYVIISSLY